MANEQYNHIILQTPPEKNTFTTHKAGGGRPSIPNRERIPHSAFLRERLQEAWQSSLDAQMVYHVSIHGIYLEFKSEPGYDLITKSLESMRAKDQDKWIRLLNIHEEDDTQYATVFVPKNKEDFFLKRIEKYATEIDKRSGKPKNISLINSLSDIRQVRLESFWQDDKKLIPDDTPQWCEIWLSSDSDEVLTSFENILNENDIRYKSGSIRFPERRVKMVYVNRTQLEMLSSQSPDIAEYRRAKETAGFFIDLQNKEQAQWVKDLLERIKIDSITPVRVLILDTGVNNGHPLLEQLLNNSDCQSVKSEWGTYDDKNHGTRMAGIIAYGDLLACLSSKEHIYITHLLESVKILPPNDHNEPELWGYITKQGISLSEIQNPDSQRIICMAVTTKDTRDRGRPSSWSGELDAVSSGAEDGLQRLIILCTGNSEFSLSLDYPAEQCTDSIHDPAQSWNALTVGAYTELDCIKEKTYDGYSPVAPKGGLSPFSTTSLTWDDKWPIKPEIMMEGGNTASDGKMITVCEDLSLLSTSDKPHKHHFDTFNATSAATAKAAWFAAQIQKNYPLFWPETIRALMVHSAEWTSTMKEQFLRNTSQKGSYRELLCACGYGVSNLKNALYSASNSLTLIAQTEIQPYYKDKDSVKTNEMHLYDLPWPKDVLLHLPHDIDIKMRITLSYYIEPGPGEVGWKDRYRYPSHLLRFDLNSPGESKDDFAKRINKAACYKDEDKPDTKSPSDYWLLGAKNRDKGSIHSDIWQGSAVDLAASNLIAIYPLTGWWKERKHLKKWNDKTRYSLIVSITTPPTYIVPEINIEKEIDIYTPVVNQIRTPISIQVKK